jgi:hypothetical protein
VSAAAVALAVAWVLRPPRGEWEVWKGHVPVRSGLTLTQALGLCAELWSGEPEDHVRAVVRLGGREVAEVDWRAEFGRRVNEAVADGH